MLLVKELYLIPRGISNSRDVGYDSVNTVRGALSSLGIVVKGCRAGKPYSCYQCFERCFHLEAISTKVGHSVGAPAVAEFGTIMFVFSFGN